MSRIARDKSTTDVYHAILRGVNKQQIFANGHKQLTDEEAWEVFSRLSGVSNLTEFQSLDRPIQKHYLYEAHSLGVGIRKLSRLTGIPYTIVRNAATADIERERQKRYIEVFNNNEHGSIVEDDSGFVMYPYY